MMTSITFFKQGIPMRIFYVVAVFLFSTISAYGENFETPISSDNPPPCSNVTSAGSISGDQSSCGSFYPTTIVSTAPASGGTGPVEYQWMYKSAATGWSLVAIPGATSIDYTPGLLSQTTKFVRCSRNQGCTSWPGETSQVVITVTNSCCNVTDGGSISGSQTNCGAFDPNPISSTAPATGGSNNPEYIWMYKNASTGWNFIAIPGTNSETYDPGTVTQTTKFRRCARNIGCSTWPGETFDVVMTVTNSCCDISNPGTIGSNQSSCGSFDPAPITSLSPAIADNGGTVEYQWMYKSASTGWNLVAISGATGLTYDPGVISETTKFRRCARVVGCSSWPGETSNVVMTVTQTCCNVTAGGSISGSQSSCGGFDPNPITSNAPASGGSNNPEYIWMYKNASTGWSFTAIPGTNSQTYDPGYITETTVYRRCARNLGCTSWPGETNDVIMTVNPGGLSASASSTNAYCTDTITVCDMTDFNGSRTIWMPNLGGTSGTSLFTIVNNSAKLYQFNDGTAHYVGKAEKTNDPNKVWVFSVWFKDKKDWTAWSAGGGSYKNGGGLTNAHLNWDYYIMDPAKPNKMVGLGDFAGVELNLTHMPSNYQYGMQLGTGANDQDGDFGMSFWYEYTSTTPAFSSGHGDFNADAPTCNNIASCGGTATATATGGTAPYVYEWSHGIYGDESKGLCTGTYTVTVTDANGCISTASTTISTTVCCNDILPGTISANQSNCGPFDPAALTTVIPATGAGATIEYIWMKKSASTGNLWVTMSSETNETFDPGLISETTEFRRCARNQGCIPYPAESNIITITINQGPTATAASTDITCNGSADGTGSMTVSGGTMPYTYAWDNGATTANLTNLAPGTYVGTATDANGCTVTETITI
ncbi:MAG: SprB repeat-containing protein, partial [Putridiphycobacter sp.]|nr:SprB repeat-containing protein [Putridiphycobacter sp.]